MARLGRRERHKKRQILETGKREAYARLAEVEREKGLKDLLPRRELAWLTSSRPNYLEVANGKSTSVAGKLHTNRAYVGRSDGSGKPEKKPMPARFLTSFMAPGHEENATKKEPLKVSYRKVGHVYRNGVKTRRVIWKEIGEA